MITSQQGIDLATRVQRRRDFTAHVTGFLTGAIVLGSLLLAGASTASLYIATLLAWATALSFQHFRHVLRGPVTAVAVQAEATRLGAAEVPDTGARQAQSGSSLTCRAGTAPSGPIWSNETPGPRAGMRRSRPWR